MTKILGLTGGIASGKSTVSKYIQRYGVPVVDADILARDVMKAGAPAVLEIRDQFGEEVLLENGEINREYLGRLIFNSFEKRNQLDAIVQGRIREALEKEKTKHLEKEPPLLVLDIPLLYEEGYEDEVDEVMVVYVDTAIQKERLLKRDENLSETDAVNRIYSQMPLSEKSKLANVLINNNGTVNETLSQVRDWLEENVPELDLNAWDLEE